MELKILLLLSLFLSGKGEKKNLETHFGYHVIVDKIPFIIQAVTKLHLLHPIQ